MILFMNAVLKTQQKIRHNRKQQNFRFSVNWQISQAATGLRGGFRKFRSSQISVVTRRVVLFSKFILRRMILFMSVVLKTQQKIRHNRKQQNFRFSVNWQKSQAATGLRSDFRKFHSGQISVVTRRVVPFSKFILRLV